MLDAAVVAPSPSFTGRAHAESGTAEVYGAAAGAKWLRPDVMLDGAVVAPNARLLGCMCVKPEKVDLGGAYTPASASSVVPEMTLDGARVAARWSPA